MKDTTRANDVLDVATQLIQRLETRLKLSKTAAEQKALSAKIKRLQAATARVGDADLNIPVWAVLSKGHEVSGRFSTKEKAQRVLEEYKRKSPTSKFTVEPVRRRSASEWVGDASPFDRDTDAGAAKMVRREAKAGAKPEVIAKKYGFSLSFVKEVLDEVRPVH